MDLVEVDAAADVNGITVRLMASVFLSFCAGLAHRNRPRLA
jgi:arginase family enzyme